MAQKILIYQIFTRLYGNKNATRKEAGTLEENGAGKFNDINDTELKGIKEMGITHVWFTGVIRHATTTDYSKYGIPKNHPAVIKGRAGSPYAITDYYDVDPDLAVDVKNRMGEWEKLVDRTHQAGLKVIMDFVPNHVAREYKSICAPEGVEGLGEGDDTDKGFCPEKNNFYYCTGCDFNPGIDLWAGEQSPYYEYPAKATGNDVFNAWPGQNDWYETVKLNYGVDYYAGGAKHFDPIPNTWLKMLSILEFWASKGVDGFRCDMAEMVPPEFWDWALTKLKDEYPNLVIIGEVYNPWLYRRFIEAGFDYLYDKVGMYDKLRDVTCGHAPAYSITGVWQATDDIQDHMLYFLENHDEQRIASDSFAGEGRKALPALAVSLLLNKNPFMLYFAQQYGERGMDKEGFSGRDGRTTIFDYWSIDSMLRAANDELTDKEQDLLRHYLLFMKVATSEKCITDGQMYDLMYANPHSEQFNPDIHYAFIRKYEDELIIVVANFGDVGSNITVKIPAHAFDYLDIKPGTWKGVGFVTGVVREVDLQPDCEVRFGRPGRGVAILKLSYSAS